MKINLAEHQHEMEFMQLDFVPIGIVIQVEFGTALS